MTINASNVVTNPLAPFTATNAADYLNQIATKVTDCCDTDCCIASIAFDDATRVLTVTDNEGNEHQATITDNDATFADNGDGTYTYTPAGGVGTFTIDTNAVVPTIVSADTGNVITAGTDGGAFLSVSGTIAGTPIANIGGVVINQTGSAFTQVSPNLWRFTDIGGNDVDLDLSPYLDDTNAARVESATINAAGLVTFTRDDASTFPLDLSSLIQDASEVPYDNTTTGFAATNTQAAIDELAADLHSPAAVTNTDGNIDVTTTGIDGQNFAVDVNLSTVSNNALETKAGGLFVDGSNLHAAGTINASNAGVAVSNTGTDNQDFGVGLNLSTVANNALVIDANGAYVDGSNSHVPSTLSSANAAIIATNTGTDSQDHSVDLKISTVANNDITINADGLFVPRQTTSTFEQVSGNLWRYTNEENVATDLDLAPYVDDTNLARIIDGTVNNAGIATFERDDNSTFTVDFAPILGNQHVAATIENNDGALSIAASGLDSQDFDVDINLSTVANNGLVINGDGLYIDASDNHAPSTISAGNIGVTVTNTGTDNQDHGVALNLSTVANNALVLDASGAYVDGANSHALSTLAADNNAITVSSTGTDSQDHKVGLAISTVANNGLVINADGLYYDDIDSHASATLTNNDGALKIVASGADNQDFDIDVNVSTVANNIITKQADGLYIDGSQLTDDQTAAEVSFDNTASGLTATTTQAAIDELANTDHAPSTITNADGALTVTNAGADNQVHGVDLRVSTVNNNGVTINPDGIYQVQEFDWRLGGAAGTTLDAAGANAPQATTDTIEREGYVSIGEAYPGAGNQGRLNVVPVGTDDAALVVGRNTGNPNITSNDAFLLGDSPETGGFAGLNYYSGDDVILSFGGGRFGVGTNAPGGGNPSYARIQSGNSGDRTLHVISPTGQSNNHFDVEISNGASGFVLDEKIRVTEGQPNTNPVTPSAGILNIDDIEAGSNISIEPTADMEEIHTITATTTTVWNGTRLTIRGPETKEVVFISGLTADLNTLPTSVGNLYLAGDFPMRKEDTLTLQYEGGIWREVSRSKNQVRNKESSRIFTILAMGQSNMVGRDNTFSDTYDVNRKISAWDANAGAWVSAEVGQEPFLEGTTTNSTNMALEIARKLEQERGHLYDEIRIVLSAQGATSINQWVGSGTASTMYADAMTQLTNAGVGFVDLILWHQGEADQNGSGTGYDTQATYLAGLDALIAQLRAEPNIGRNVPFIAGELLQGGAMSDRNDAISTLFSNADEWTGVATSQGVGDTGDNIHFNTTGLKLMGQERYWEAYLKLPYNSAGMATTANYPNYSNDISTSPAAGTGELIVPAGTRLVRINNSVSATVNTISTASFTEGDKIIAVGTGGQNITMANNGGGSGRMWLTGNTDYIMNSSVNVLELILINDNWVETGRGDVL